MKDLNEELLSRPTYIVVKTNKTKTTDPILPKNLKHGSEI